MLESFTSSDKALDTRPAYSEEVSVGRAHHKEVRRRMHIAPTPSGLVKA